MNIRMPWCCLCGKYVDTVESRHCPDIRGIEVTVKCHDTIQRRKVDFMDYHEYEPLEFFKEEADARAAEQAQRLAEIKEALPYER